MGYSGLNRANILYDGLELKIDQKEKKDRLGYDRTCDTSLDLHYNPPDFVNDVTMPNNGSKKKLFVFVALIEKFTNLPFRRNTTTGTFENAVLPLIFMFALPLNTVLLSLNTIALVGEGFSAPVEFVSSLIERVPFALPSNLYVVASHLKFCNTPLLTAKLQFPPIIDPTGGACGCDDFGTCIMLLGGRTNVCPVYLLH